MTTRLAASSGGSAFKLGASLEDQLDRSRARLHPCPQCLDASECRERARRIAARGKEVVTQDALGGAVDVLVVARSVLSEPLERPSLQSYRSGHRRHEQSLSTPPYRVKGGGTKVRARERGAHPISPKRAKPRGRPQAPDACTLLQSVARTTTNDRAPRSTRRNSGVDASPGATTAVHRANKTHGQTTGMKYGVGCCPVVFVGSFDRDRGPCGKDACGQAAVHLGCEPVNG